jgi:predicted TIM-barrel fold metal-dependent hydrolase
MIIDGHAHACGPFLKGEDIVEILAKTGVDKVVLVPGELDSQQTYALPGLAERFPKRDVVRLTNALTRIMISLTGKAADIPEGNRRVYTLAQAYPERIIQFYWILLQKPDAVQEMKERFVEWKFRGIKLHQCWDNFSIGSERFAQVAEFAAEKNLPIFIHAGNYKEVAALIDHSERHPATKFIVGHLFGLELYLQSKQKLENLFFEISNTYLVSTLSVNKAIDRFGAHRIILGSDTPYGRNSLQRNIDRVKTLSISEEAKEMILGKNMQVLLQLN